MEKMEGTTVVSKPIPELLKCACKFDPVMVGYTIFAADIQRFIDEYIRKAGLDGYETSRFFVKRPESPKPELHVRCYFNKRSGDINTKVNIPDMIRDRMDENDNFSPSQKFREAMEDLTSQRQYINTFNKDHYSVTLDVFKVLAMMFSLNTKTQQLVVDTCIQKKKNAPLTVNVVKQYKPIYEETGDKFTEMIKREVGR